MGKVIQFPTARIRQPRQPSRVAFAAFGEMQLVERAQLLKLLGGCLASAMLLVAVLQLAAG
jgi:hypothetical protein